MLRKLNFKHQCIKGVQVKTGIAAFNIGSGSATKLMYIARYLKSLNQKLKIEVRQPDPLYPKRSCLDIGKAQALLGFRPKYSIIDGLRILYNSI